MYADHQLGAWGVGRALKKTRKKLKKFVDKNKALAVALGPLSTSVTAITHPKETALVSAAAVTGGAAIGAGIAAGGGSAAATGLLAKAQAFFKDPQLRAALDAARSLKSKPKTAAVPVEETAPEMQAGGITPSVLVAGAIGVTILALMAWRK